MKEKTESVPLTDMFLELTAEEKDDFQQGLDEFIGGVQEARTDPDKCFIVGVIEREGQTGIFFNGGASYPITLLFSGILLAVMNDDNTHNNENIEKIYHFLQGIIEEEEAKAAMKASAVH